MPREAQHAAAGRRGRTTPATDHDDTDAGHARGAFSPPLKKSYEVLPAGRAELARWTAASQDPKPHRDTMLLRLRASAVVGTEGIESDLRRHLALHQHQLTEYQDIEKRDFRPGITGPQDRLQHLVLRAGIDLETFWTQWLTHALTEFAELPADRNRPTE